jgi:pyruvate dehydrogenase E2 component (dihydrolipoyllysine-residue acetyltransferase)
MASDVTMPRLSDSMEEGTVLKWLVDEGGEVKRGEPLVEIETDKANMTYDADTDGVLIEIVAQEGDTLEIGEVIARIGDAGEAKAEGDGKAEEGGAEAGAEEAEAEAGEEEGAEEGGEEAEEAGAEEEKEPAIAEAEGGEAAAEGEDEGEAKGEEAEGAEAEAKGEQGEAEGEEAAAASADEGGEEQAAAEGDEEAAPEEAAVAGAEGGGGETQAGAGTATREKTSGGNGDGRVKASPVARRMARDLGVELAALEGTGPGGRIVKADVQAAAENGGAAQKEAPERGEAETAEEPAGDGAKAKDEKKAKAKDEKAEEKPAKKEPQKAEAGAKGEVNVEELTRLQQTVSRRMAESKATAPDFSIALTVDMTAAVDLRSRLKEIS